MWVCEHTDPKYLSLAINEAQGNVGLVNIHMQSVWAWQSVKPMVTWVWQACQAQRTWTYHV
jgi:hypothetical protein